MRPLMRRLEEACRLSHYVASDGTSEAPAALPPRVGHVRGRSVLESTAEASQRRTALRNDPKISVK